MPRSLKSSIFFTTMKNNHEDHSYYMKYNKEVNSNTGRNIDSTEISIDDERIREVHEEIVFDETSLGEIRCEQGMPIEPFHEENPDKRFLSKLSFWAISRNIKRTDLSELLNLMKEEGKISDNININILLQTPKTKKNVIENMENGKYLHFDIDETIKNILFSFSDKELISNDLKLSFNVDGTPISTSGGYSFWIILGCINNLRCHVFPIGIFKATSKPENCNVFLKKFVEEMINLTENGIIFKSKLYNIIIHSFVCDAPAMAFIKQVKSHGGYYCCQKCFIRGESVAIKNNRRKVVYKEINSPLRTDNSFRNRVDDCGRTDEGHHKKDRSILEQLPVDMIQNFALDKMHLVDEGVGKKLIQIWLGKPSSQKLSFNQIRKLNHHLKLCYKYSCSEFQRNIRTMNFAAFMKASEYRVFLLYAGPVVLKPILKSSAYKHFLCLSLAIRILSSECYYNIYNNYADDLLKYFVKHFPKLYGLQNMTYNVHCLIHLARDALHLGTVDENSCYKFESYIKTIKSFLHSANRPLEQCYNRLSEQNTIKHKLLLSEKVSTSLEKNVVGTNIYEKCIFPNFVITCKSFGNNCLMLKNNQIIRVKYFEKQANGTLIYGQQFYNKCPINNEPMDLEEFHIMFGKFSKKFFKYNIKNLTKDVACKICCLPYRKDIFFVSPLSHTLNTT